MSKAGPPGGSMGYNVTDLSGGPSSAHHSELCFLWGAGGPGMLQRPLSPWASGDAGDCVFCSQMSGEVVRWGRSGELQLPELLHLRPGSRFGTGTQRLLVPGGTEKGHKTTQNSPRDSRRNQKPSSHLSPPSVNLPQGQADLTHEAFLGLLCSLGSLGPKLAPNHGLT